MGTALGDEGWERQVVLKSPSTGMGNALEDEGYEQTANESR